MSGSYKNFVRIIQERCPDVPRIIKKTVEIMGEEAGESSKQIQRYLKVTELISNLIISAVQLIILHGEKRIRMMR